MTTTVNISSIGDLLDEGQRCLQAMHGILAAVDEHHPYIRAGMCFCVEELEKRLDGIEAILKSASPGAPAPKDEAQ